MGKPHVHADLIKAWADGAEIEQYHENFQCWEQTSAPMWHPMVKYRIKPQPMVFYCGLTYSVRSKGPHIWLSSGYFSKCSAESLPGLIGILKVVVDPDTKELISATLEK